MRRYLFLILLGCYSFIYAQVETSDFTDLRGDYLGQELPGDTPEVFARGIVSTDNLEHSPALFTSDGNDVFWITVRIPDKDSGERIIQALTMHRKKGRWSAPSAIPYQIMALSDDNTGYFTSRENKDIWITKKKGDAWSEPECLNLLKQYPELQFVYIGSVTQTGTLYFTAYLEGPMNNYGIYRSERINGNYAKPEALPGNINKGNGTLNWTPYVDPDDRYIIFSSNREGEFGEGDLYISFHDKSAGIWSEPVNMGASINTGAQERFPSVSPDGKYLFFTRWTPDHNQDVYWVSAGIIEKLRAKYAKK